MWGCPFAVMGMKLALHKADIAQFYLDGIKQLQALFHRMLLQSGLSQPHADVLSERLVAVYQGSLILGRLGQDRARLKYAKESMIQIYKEYRAFHAA